MPVLPPLPPVSILDRATDLPWFSDALAVVLVATAVALGLIVVAWLVLERRDELRARRLSRTLANLNRPYSSAHARRLAAAAADLRPAYADARRRAM